LGSAFFVSFLGPRLSDMPASFSVFKMRGFYGSI
jgi:hypothetical protein